MNGKKRLTILLLFILLTVRLWGIDKQTLSIYNEGAVFFRAGKYRKALVKFKQAADFYRKSPGYLKAQLGKIYVLIGKSYEKIKKYTEAEKYYKKIYRINKNLRNKPGMASNLYSLGLVYRKSGKYQSAVKSFRRALEINRVLGRNQQVSSYLYVIAMTYRTWKRYKDAVSSLLEAVKFIKKHKLPGISIYLYYAGVSSRESGDFKSALKYFNMALKQPADSNYRATYLNGIGNTFRDMKNYKRALGYYMKAYRKNTNSAFTLIYIENIARIYSLLKKVPQEVRWYKTALKHLQKNPEKEISYLDKISKLYKVSGNNKLAILYLKRLLFAVENTGDKAAVSRVLNRIGLICIADKSYNKALKYLKRSLSIDKKLADKKNIAVSYNNLAIAYDSLKNYNKALMFYKKALSLSKGTGNKKDRASFLFNTGTIYSSMGKYNTAKKYFIMSLKINKEIKNKKGIHENYIHIGRLYQFQGNYKLAYKNFNKVLKIASHSGNKSEVIKALISIGQIHQSWGRYSKAVKIFMKALIIAKRSKNPEAISSLYNNIGYIYKEWGYFKRAVSYFKKSMAISYSFGKKSNQESQYVNIGLVYMAWGDYKKSLEYFNKALLENKSGTDRSRKATIFNNKGLVFYFLKKYDKALSLFKRAYSIDRKLGHKDKLSIRLNNIALVYIDRGKYYRAMRYYKQALAIEKKLGREESLAVYLNNIGDLYHTAGDFKKALIYYKRSLFVDKKHGKKPGIARGWGNIGILFYKIKKFKKAVLYLKKSVNLIEKLRKTAPGRVRRDYFASQLYNYQWLIYSYLAKKQYINAFNTAELSKAKYLIEQMSGDLKKGYLNIIDIGKYQKTIPKDTAVISYANMDIHNSVQLIATSGKVYGKINTEDNLKIHVNIKNDCNVSSAGRRGVTLVKTMDGRKNTIVKRASVKKLDKKGNVLINMVNYFRVLLSKRVRTLKEKRSIKKIGRALYSFLFNKIQPLLKGKKKLIIIPDGILAFIPFEALIMPDGRYLIEKYSISYTQSLSILKIIKSRKYGNSRRPLIGFGGAVYEDKGESVISDIGLLRDTFLTALKRGKSSRNIYKKMGYSNWENLPATLKEVKQIGHIVKGSVIYKGEHVSENFVKILSKTGELKKYKVIHFATHGLAVPEVPELSAIVLSLFKKERRGEDGYLRMPEIIQLKTRADFVNLSACETGLGKIYAGEGVVGLVQSFLIAGANGLSVSLWQVADVSTMKFMIGLYSLVQKRKIGYNEAVRSMKLKFIHGFEKGKYKDPFYWAPFVYYGK